MNTVIDRLLRRYDDAPYLLRSKARFLLYVCFSVMIIMPVGIWYTGFLQLINPLSRHAIILPVLAPSFAIMAITGAVIVFLMRGWFRVAAHLFLLGALTCIWTVMLVDAAETVSRLDTISLVFAALTILPIVVLRKKRVIIIYVAANIIMLYAFMFHVRSELHLSFNSFWDFLADNTLALAIVSITLYNVYAINQRAIERAENEIADRRRAEEERSALQQQLFRSQKLESLGMLAGGIAHDFNNMLSVIIGYADMLKIDLAAQPQAREQLERISEAAMRSREMTRRLLAFARRQPLETKPIDLNSLIADFGSMIARLVRTNVTVDVRIGDRALMVRADENQLVQVLLNLVLNAQDAMPDAGGIVIEARTALVDARMAQRRTGCAPGRYHVLQVSDTGPGIAPEIKEKIFDPFFTTKTPGAGTGLGLSIVYGIVAQHGGFVDVSSEPGAGSVFAIYLPADGMEENERRVIDGALSSHG